MDCKGEYDFLHRISKIVDNMYITITKEKGDEYYDYFFSFKCGKEKWWMNIETYDYFKENTVDVNDFDKNMYDSLVKFLEYFLKDVDIIKEEDYLEGDLQYFMVLVDEDKYKKIKKLLKKESPENVYKCFTKMIYDFLKQSDEFCKLERNDIKWLEADNDKTISLNINMENNSIEGTFDIFKIRFIKDFKKWWDDEFEKIENEGVIKHFEIKNK